MAEKNDSLRTTFLGATEHLGFSAVEKAHLLNGKSIDDPRAFTRANIGDVIETIAQVAVGLAIMIDDDNAVHSFMRDKTMPGLGGQTIADCILSRSPQKLKSAVKAMETRLDLS